MQVNSLLYLGFFAAVQPAAAGGQALPAAGGKRLLRLRARQPRAASGADRRHHRDLGGGAGDRQKQKQECAAAVFAAGHLQLPGHFAVLQILEHVQHGLCPSGRAGRSLHRSRAAGSRRRWAGVVSPAALSYTLDVYSGGRCRVEPDLFHFFALFVSFFPTLFTGPIERYPHLRPQIKKSRRFSYSRCAGGAFRMLWGTPKSW